MTTTTHDTRTRALSAQECRDRISAHDEARLGFWSGCGPRSVVVPYVVVADEVVLVLPEYHPALGHVVGADVTLDVEADAGGCWERVRACGTARPGSAPAALPDFDDWPPGVATHPVHVPLARLEGVATVG